MIYFKNIDLKYGNKRVFHDFNLHIEAGEKVAVKGRSGQGKTSLFNMLMGFIYPDSGTINIAGLTLNIENIRKIRKLISWLPQNINFIGNGKVYDHILQPFLFSVNKEIKPNKNILISSLERLNLDKTILDSSFEDISGGEKQRIEILICRLLNRPILLLDEPSSALDKENLHKVVDFLLLDKEITILSASHDDEWLKNCSRIIEIDQEK